MKVILKEEVINLGLPGDVVDVADGYARNFLIPRGMAIHATGNAMKQAEAMVRSRKAKEAETLDEAQEHREKIEAITLRIEARVDDLGHLYGSVGSRDVHRVLKERGFEVDERRIDLKGTIKELGTYEVPVQIHPQVVAEVTVDVVDVEGKIQPGGKVEVEVDEDAIKEAALKVAQDVSGTADVDTLAEQALEAAREYEEQQAMAGETEAGAPAPETQDTDEEGDPIQGAGPRGATEADEDEDPAEA
ncbi:MAG: 50S ribosomal protein L9 [Nitriliruptorales bacterium]|nr:50S ribosomal protein L9 [Nitriliruptorales bacterium]